MIKFVTAKVLSNARLETGYFDMKLEAPELAESARPGQFIMVGCSPDGAALDPLLRRPFSLARACEGCLEIVYAVAGRGSGLLSKLGPGDSADLLGPLGNGFPRIADGKRPALVAGGYGIAPLLWLAETEKARDKIFLYFAANKASLIETDSWDIGQTELLRFTEDGSAGRKGILTEEILGACLSASDAIYACGPRGMLKATAAWATRNGVECYVSMEERMACGVGACYGCAIKVGGWYKRVCKDGPVFAASEIDWEE